MKPMTLGEISSTLDSLGISHTWDPEGCKIAGTDWVLRAGGGAADPHRWFLWNLKTNYRSELAAKTPRQLNLLIKATLKSKG